MDTNFSIAIHILILVSEADEPLSSSDMAESVGVQSSLIRKVAGLLKKAGIMDSQQGVPGFRLLKDPANITLLDVYQSIYAPGQRHLFLLHKNPNDKCLVGRYIRPVLSESFALLEEQMTASLEGTTLKDVISRMREALARDNALPHSHNKPI